jgi:NAD(P)-dependent dehydrogenase (short-subunit alcohol dehydrogenase family)
MTQKAVSHAVNRLSFEGQAAVVTGGAQGIGFAVAERLLASACKVALWDRNDEVLAGAVADLARRFGTASVHGATVDITSPRAVAAGTESTLAAFGRIDVLINNAGLVGPNLTLVEYPEDEWTAVMETNINGTFNCCKRVVPLMQKAGYGRIVNIASIAGKEGNPNASAYSTSKAAVIGLTKSLGKELAGQDIAVNCVTPAVAATPGAMQQAPSHIEYMLSKIPRGRLLELDEAAAMICWIASAENSFTTGAVFDLSGGRATY